MDGKIFLFFCLLVVQVLCQTLKCPKKCRCLPRTVRCINVRLTRIPINDIPVDTTVLDLRYNYIKEIKRTDLQKLVNLENLFVGNNEVSNIESNAFADLKNLKYLYLFSNKITEIKTDTFAGLVNLEQLYLQNNIISVLPQDAFKDLALLRRLYLHRNGIANISNSLIEPIKSLKRLRVGSNEIKCTCEFIKFVKQITVEGNIYIGATCHHDGREVEASSVTYSDLGCYQPRFLKTPGKKVGIPGYDLSLQCKADGFPIPTITWLKDGNNLPEQSNYQFDQPTGTLTLKDFNPSVAGYYQCIIQNVIGKNAASATVVPATVEALPTFTEQPTDVDAILNGLALFHCRATGYPRPTIVWNKNGNSIDIEQSDRFKLLNTGDLEIQEVTMNDGGYYTCRAENQLGSVTQSAKLIVKAPPSFVRQPKNLDMLEGETASFECKATGYPRPAIAWQKDGTRLPSDGRHAVLPSGTLRILYVRKANEGVYECQAINVIGVIAVQANLTIKSRVEPAITVKPADTTVQSGNTISFQCNANGAPNPVITWIRNGVQVITGNRFQVNGTTGTIEIKDIGKVDAGRWQCVARNSIGFAAEAFSITVIGPKDGNYKGDQFVLESLAKARQEVDRAIELTKQKLESFSPRTPGDLLALFRFPSPDAVKIARSAEIFEIALELIQKSVDSGILNDGMKLKYHFNGLVSPEHIKLLANLSGCTAHKRLVNCSDLCFHHKYRAFDGSCNNFNHPMWGASLTPFSRLLIPNYENGFNTPYGWNNTDLPSAREISLDIISSKNVTSDGECTHMLMQWGQFLDHDFSFTVSSPSTSRFNDGLSCRDTCENQQPCFPIKIPKHDRRIKKYKCMEFTRSSAVCGSGSTSLFFDVITPRQQINQITSFIDASNVYGSSEKDARDLRSFENDKGLLKQGVHFRNGKFMLPFNQDTPIDCQVNVSESRVPCFLAGDHRANEQLGLLSMHTLWMREHNRIATELGRLNPHWNGEKIYQESRKIVGAEMQHITYNEWLPNIIGQKGMDKLGSYSRYNQNVEPNIFNAFATAVFRFGHTLIQPVLARLDENFEETKEGHLPLHKAFFSPYRIIEEGGVDPLIRGLFATAAKDRTATNQPFNEELTERLFAMAHAVALDLAALNIQRGRDHGLPFYNSWRQLCGLSVAKDFNDLLNEIKDVNLIKKLKDVYKNVEHIDLFVGGILEDPLPGTRLGPTFSCLVTKQFQRLRQGDRFWYENPSMFKPEQLNQIKQTKLSRVICDNSDNIRHVQPDAFKRVDRKSEYTPCFQHPIVDLRFWKECCSQDKTCNGRFDQSSTITNFIRENNVNRPSNNVQRDSSPVSRRVRRSLNETVYEELKESKKSTEYQPKETKHSKKQKKMNSRIKTLEDKINHFDYVLNNLKQELSDLKNDFNYVKRNKSEYKFRQCIDEHGIVKDHGENWFDYSNRKCMCKNSKIYCS